MSEDIHATPTSTLDEESPGLTVDTDVAPSSHAPSTIAQQSPDTGDYSLGAHSSLPLSALPEDVEVDLFSGPTIHVTSDESEASPQAPWTSFEPAEPTTLEASPSTNGLSPVVPSSPDNRRRSSFSGHSRRSSVGQAIPSSPSTRRRSSIVSTGSRNEFDDFQEGDVDGSEFGDFDDFVDGEFEDEDTYVENEVLDQRSETPAAITLPDIEREDEMRSHTIAAIDALFGDQNAEPSGTATNEDTMDDANLTKEANAPDDSDEEDSPFMLTDRAVSLWKQLTAPPPLQPPDWKRSRIRRLFLVSSGIPVDLDEILPKMTHKKLVLPSTRKNRDKKSTDDRRSRKKIPPPPEFEISTARTLCTTTRTALSAMTERDLQIHISTLQAHTAAASGLLTYWLEQREIAQSEKDTFEQVVQNLVKYHKKQKDEQKEASANSKKKTKSRFSMRG